jgi:uncharacterized protein YcbX
MPQVVDLYRHPVKSFTPERLDELRVADGKITGDRVLGFRFADQGAPDDWSWRRKHNFVALANTPGIAELELSFNEQSRLLSLKYHGEIFAEGSIDSIEDRADLSEAVGEFATALDVNPLVGHPERVPLNLIGDGKQGLFHDSVDGGVTLYSTESLAALSSHMNADLDGRRFRANVVVDGVEAWQELSWSGLVTIGASEYEVVKAVTRCLATHANPVNGERDQDVMKSLIAANGLDEPIFAVRLSPLDEKAVIRVGDSVTVG